MNGTKRPINTKSVAILNIQIPFLPYVNNQAFSKSITKVIHFFNTLLIQPNITGTYTRSFDVSISTAQYVFGANK